MRPGLSLPIREAGRGVDEVAWPYGFVEHGPDRAVDVVRGADIAMSPPLPKLRSVIRRS